jgi:outer membrane protein
MTPDAIYQEAVGIKPEILAETLRLQGTEKNIDIAKSALYPSLSLSGGVGSNYYKTSGFPAESFGKQLSNNFSQYIGLNLTVPIFNRFATRNSVRTAQLNRENQQMQLENTKKALYKEIQQAYYNAVNSKAKYASSEEALRSNREAFTLMSAKYEYGKANITEFNEAKNNLMKAESDLVRAKYEYLYNHALLSFYRGKELKF